MQGQLDPIQLMRKIAELEDKINAMRTIEIGGVWQNWTPVPTAEAGTLTTVSASGKYAKIGKVVAVQLVITITTNGTGSGAIRSNLPINNDFVTIITGRETNATGKLLQGLINSNAINIYNYDNTYPGGDGHTLYMTGIYSIE